MAIYADQIFGSDGEGTQEGGVIAIRHATQSNDLVSSSHVAQGTGNPTTSSGIEIFSIAHAMQNAGNKLLFISEIYGNEDSNLGDNLTFGHFAGSTLFHVGYRHVTGGGPSSGDNYGKTTSIAVYEPNTSSSITYSIRGACNAGDYEHMASTTYSQNNHYCGNRNSTLIIMEISSS